MLCAMSVSLSNAVYCGTYVLQAGDPPQDINVICQDGKCLEERYDDNNVYCGNGACNMFGYNCDRGCRYENHTVCIENCLELAGRDTTNNCEAICPEK